MEDWPFWLKCLAAGYKIDFMPLVTVYYRKSFESLTSYSSQIFYNENFYRVERSFIRTEIFPKVSAWNFLYWNDRLVMDFKHFVLYSVLKNKKIDSPN